MKRLLLAIMCLAGVSFAHDGATGVVKQRMDAMSNIGKANKVLTNIARGRADFEPETVHAAAQQIANNSGEHLLMMFPENSLTAPSEATPEIWQNWDEFSQLALTLAEAAEAMTEINDEANFKPAFYAIADTCKGCHRNYRLQK